ncbi:hypothetical protein SDC9_185343 [bioreactor metagenome]|uniref:Uncharacterized protein n=1 Tax=bioreactor metagenome TaxID=1076179 RepID=A0A645HHF7_9ZZZZ
MIAQKVGKTGLKRSRVAGGRIIAQRPYRHTYRYIAGVEFVHCGRFGLGAIHRHAERATIGRAGIFNPVD